MREVRVVYKRVSKIIEEMQGWVRIDDNTDPDTVRQAIDGIITWRVADDETQLGDQLLPEEA